jgi:hypothetical protein
MLPHGFLCLALRVPTTTAGTPDSIASRPPKRCFHEIIGLVDPFMTPLSITSVAGVHPLTVIHPLPYNPVR